MRILMVCLGNICRSPMAHGVLEKLIREHNLPWYVDSAGTNGYHNGESPDQRAINCASQYGVDLSGQISRQISERDLMEFDLILAMDDVNLKYLRRMAKNQEQLDKIKMLMHYHNEFPDGIVPDPYYDNRFNLVFELVDAACRGLVRSYTKI